MLSSSHKFLFVHIPKTGGNSIQQVLAPYSEDRIVALDEQDGRERFEVRGRFTRRKHATLSEYRESLPAELYAEAHKFCAVRDPWSRAISFYFTPRRWLKRGLEPFWSKEHFLETLSLLPPMVDYLKVDGRIQALDDIIEFEHLSEQLARVLRRLGIDADPLPHLNRSLAGDYRAYYASDPDLVEVVAERYREDVAHFGYRFER